MGTLKKERDAITEEANTAAARVPDTAREVVKADEAPREAAAELDVLMVELLRASVSRPHPLPLFSVAPLQDLNVRLKRLVQSGWLPDAWPLFNGASHRDKASYSALLAGHAAAGDVSGGNSGMLARCLIKC
ncbi:hypothetical protein ZWY2020_006046 [Hordeum vulgare]|nr:hypothetical protein ZWY2020_006046 [Hordeum vulgare]